jgi:large subunit ribosomal protein L24
VSLPRIKKNDVVIATKGKEGQPGAQRKGKVLEVDLAKGRVLVEGLNMVKRNIKKSKERPKGGIVTKEASIAISNLMPFCPVCKKGVRVRCEKESDDRKIRKCRRCGHAFDS